MRVYICMNVLSVKESCHTRGQVMSHKHTNHATQANESGHTCKHAIVCACYRLV